MTAPAPQPTCQCPLHGQHVCPFEAVVSCFYCGRALCIDNRCSKPIFTDKGWVRVCEPTLMDSLCFRVVGLRQDYAAVSK